MFDILGRWGVSGGGAAGAPPQEQAKGHANNHHHGHCDYYHSQNTSSWCTQDAANAPRH